jgi:hypothetical protein
MSARFVRTAQEDEYLTRHSIAVFGPTLEEEDCSGDGKWWYHWMRCHTVPEADELHHELLKEAARSCDRHAADIATELLPNAVCGEKYECIAVLMRFGASPYVRYRRYDRKTALELVSCLRNTGDVRIPYFIGVLVNVEKRELSPRLAQVFDIALGKDREGPLRENTEDGMHEVIMSDYETALTFAVKRRYVHCVKWLLIGLGVDANTPSGDGLTPLELAMERFPKPRSGGEPAESYRRKLGIWEGMIEALVHYAIGDEHRWRREWPRDFPDAYPALRRIIREKFGLEL